MRSWLTSKVAGKGKSQTSVNTLVSRILKVFRWTFNAHYHEDIVAEKLRKWLRRLVKRYPQLIVSYFGSSFLGKSRAHRPS